MTPQPDKSAPYAELAVTTNYSFLRGGSHPHELVETAAALGLAAIGIADRNTLAGIVRAHVAAKNHGLRLIPGSRLVLIDGFELLCFPTNRAAYSRLTGLLTLGNRRAPKAACHLQFEDLQRLGDGQHLIAIPPYNIPPDNIPQDSSLLNFADRLKRLSELFPARTSLAVSLHYRGNDQTRLKQLMQLSRSTKTPLAATNDVLYHIPQRRPLQDILTCIRSHCNIDEAGFRLAPNAERHLKAPDEMHRLFTSHDPALSEAFARTAEIADDCRFCLDELSYDYPDEPAGGSASPQDELVRLTWIGAAKRFPDGIDDKLRGKIEHELQLIAQMQYAPYFLTVFDIVRFARTRTPPILCQGRGSAANSVVCYCLGITAVNPQEIDLLFERFISAERDEPPDIDVDFEHERREEVIQYIYRKYGRHRAGLAATVISYRARSALREVGKAMGLSEDVVSALAGVNWGPSSKPPQPAHIREAGLDPQDPRLAQTLKLAGQIIGFPRHLSQHVGGFVITRNRLDALVPIANAAMAERTVVEWDKDDLDALNILKIDILSLGMLTCLRKSFELLSRHYNRDLGLARVPREDQATYRMIQKADTVGVFQIESRAQMSMLPRLKPATFYDLVIEIALIRPGPIQGDMVHPYLRRRQGLEAVEYPSDELRRVLEKTKGVPLFQEQAMKIAIVAAGFSPTEADQLRRAMASFRRTGDIGNFRDRFIRGMLKRGYTPEFAARCFKQIEGFSDYGFPESHSASFVLLAYASSWLKCHHPDVFACALLNSQPMGFYSTSSIVRDFRDHDGEVRPVDINMSDWDHSLERCAVPRPESPPASKSPPQPPSSRHALRHALRLGFRQVAGLREDDGRKIATCRPPRFANIRDFYVRTRLGMGALQRLAHADAFCSIGLDRRAALWEIRGLGGARSSRLNGYARKTAAVEDLPLFRNANAANPDPTAPQAGLLQNEEPVALPALLAGEHVIEDYESLRLSLKAHPLQFMRHQLNDSQVATAEELARLPPGRTVSVAGLVLVRQRPGSASGVIFMTLEDETGIANIIVWPKVYERHRRVVLGARMVCVKGQMQNEQGVIHIIAQQLSDLTSELMQALTTDLAAPAPAPTPAQQTPATKPRIATPAQPRRHPRNVRVLPKGRNFH